MADFQTHYVLGNLTSAKTYFDKIYDIDSGAGYSVTVKSYYDDFVTNKISKKRISCYESPNRLTVASWNTIEGTIYDEIIALGNTANALCTLYNDVYSKIVEGASDDVAVDSNNSMMSGVVSLTVPDQYSAATEQNAVANEQSDEDWFDYALNFLKGLCDFVGRLLASFVDLCVSLLLGLCQLVEGIVDAVAMLIGTIAYKSGDMYTAQLMQAFIAKDWTNDVIGASIYSFTGLADASFLPDWVRGVAQETGRWVGIAALSCILPGSGAFIGGLLGGVSGFGIGAEGGFQAGADYDRALGYACVRGVVDALIGRHIGAQFNGGVSWKQYVQGVKNDGFFKTTNAALKQGVSDLGNIIFPSSQITILNANPSMLQSIGTKLVSFSTTTLFPSMVLGSIDTALDMVVGVPQDVIFEGGQRRPLSFEQTKDSENTATTPDNTTPNPEPEQTPNPEPEPTPNPEPEPAPNPEPNPTPNPKPEPTPDQGTSSSDNGPTDNPSGSDPEYNQNDGQTEPGSGDGDVTGDTPSGDDTPGSGDTDLSGGEDSNPGDDYQGEDDTPGSGDDSNPGDDFEGEDNPNPGGDEPSLGGDDEPDNGNYETNDPTNDPSHPKVSVDNVGPGSVTLQDAGALGAGMLGAAGIAGGYGGSYGGGYAGAGTGAIDGSNPQYANTTNENKDDEDEKNKKDKYTFESMTPTVENPALDAGLLDTPTDNVIMQGPEPGPSVNTLDQGTGETSTDAVEGLDSSEASDTVDNQSMDADKTNLNTVLGLGGISAGVGIGGVYLAQAKKDAEEEQKTKDAARNLGVAGGMMGAVLMNNDEEKINQTNDNNYNGFNQ